MSNYKRTAAARRSKPRKAGRLLSFAVLLSLVAVFTITANAIASSGVTVIASGFGENMSRVRSTTRQTDSVNPSEQQPELAIPPVHNESEDWMLLLVNPWNRLPDDYEVTLTQLKNGHAVDERCYPDLQQMMDDCRAEGLQPLICSSYRSQDKQQRLFDNKVNSLIAQGYSQDAAREKAGTVIAVPGTSEHQTGLAVDIVDINNQNLDESQENTPVQQWLMENSWRYGFILRYPSDKSDITGIVYEPWHYRYVGKEAAKEIFEQGICLDEYLAG